MEDDPGLSQLMQKRLQRQGYQVVIAGNGEEGLALARKESYDLLVVDYNMPFLGGLEVIRTLIASGSAVPMIMVTGEGNESVAVEAIKVGAADYIVKDVELRFLELLPSVIHQALYRQQLLIDRKRMEEQVRQSEERYRNLFENNPHPMWVFDIETHRFLAANDAAVRHYGYSREEFLAMSLKDIRPDDEIPRFLEASSGFGADGIQSELWQHRKKDGTILYVEIVSHPIVFGDRRARLSLITDITARKKIEEELMRAQKLESVGTLAGGLAHDFNNLLTGIIANVSLARYDARDGKDVSEHLAAAEKATERAQRLTHQLLTFARGGAPVKRPFAVAELVRDMTFFALRGSRCKPEFSIPADLWPVEGDEGQLSQVITSLLSNADNAMPSGGTIRIACRNIRIEHDNQLPLPNRCFVVVTVADDGVGIPNEHLEKIFDPYFTTKDRSSGLGLATAYSIIKRHDGHITAESSPGSGSRFTVYLPSPGVAAASDARREMTASPTAETGRVLIMDDEEMIRDVAGKILSRLGYEVNFARDGAEALSLYQQAHAEGKPYGAVIMDLTIPGGMGGKETVERIRRIDPSVRAIVSSGYSDDPIMAEYENHGFCGVVCKPYSIKVLGDTVKQVFAAQPRNSIPL
jgi:PAS domain S-box-containing protein